MIETLGQPEVQDFLAKHATEDPAKVALLKNLPAAVPASLLASQLKARQKAKVKLPSWYARDGIIFPHGVALEQCSSETTARWKAAYFGRGKSFLDLTGGTGVDAWAFAEVFAEGVLVEPDAERTKLLLHNLHRLNRTNITVIESTAADFLASNSRFFDFIYLDPDRRAGGQKAVDFSNSEPDVVKLLPELLKFSEQLLIKASPMLDIRLAVNQLQSVFEVVVLAVQNEVRELLFLVKRTPAKTRIRAVNLKQEGSEEEFSYYIEDETAAEAEYGPPSDFIYEPNAAILKAGAFKLTGVNFGLQKLHTNTHLYTSSQWVEDFPGRCFRVLEILPFTSTVAKAADFGFSGAHVLTRNFPLPAAELQKKLKLREGEQGYVIGTTFGQNQRCLIIAERLK